MIVTPPESESDHERFDLARLAIGFAALVLGFAVCLFVLTGDEAFADKLLGIGTTCAALVLGYYFRKGADS